MENTPNFAAEVKENEFYILAKSIAGKMSEIGSGALAGAAAAMIPTDKMNPIQKFCIGFGAYGIAKWVSRSSKQAIKDDMDDFVQTICDNLGPIKNLAHAIADAQKETTEEDEEEDSPEVN